jgi:aspartate racemase
VKALIGIVGGMGPAAGVLFARHLVDLAPAASDQGHPSFVLVSRPSEIADRTEFLLGRTAVNPGLAIADHVADLVGLGATHVAIPCNTAHAPAILAPVLGVVDAAHPPVRLLHLIDTVVTATRVSHPAATRIGLLSTAGTLRVGLYRDAIRAAGVEPVMSTADEQERLVDPAIRLVKAGQADRATDLLARALDALVGRGAQVTVLGCTELPLAVRGGISDRVLVDPLVILADAVLAAVTDDDRVVPPSSADR